MPTAPEPRWLDDEEMDAWIQMATTLAHLPHALDAQLLRDAQITHFEYEVMSALSEAPERTLRMSELAELSYGSLSRLSHVVGRLEKRNWVRRHSARRTDGSPMPFSPRRVGRRSWRRLPVISRMSANSSSTG